MPLTMSGFGELGEAISNIAITNETIESALLRASVPTAMQMRANAPAKSGALKSAIQVGKAKSTKTGKKVTIGVHRADWGGGEYYPAYVEYGHKGPHPAAAHPWCRPAFDATKDECAAIIIDVLTNKIQF